MRKVSLIFGILITANYCFGQTNTFPSSGNVGIGTATPQGALQVMNSSAGFDGSNVIYLTNDNTSYGRTNLILTGRLTNSNDAWAFGSGARNSIVFNVNQAADGANVGAIGTEYYSIQLEGNSKSLGFLSNQNGASPNLVLLQNGNVGIGTTSPSGKLTVDYSNGDPKSLSIFSSATDLVNSPIGGLRFSWYGANYADIQMVRGNDAIDGLGLAFLTSTSNSGTTTEAMRITPNGSVGIGTASPQSKLAVNGTITATEVKVTQTGWPDFVFDRRYILPALSTTAKYIKVEHHLPGIPSAKQIESKGLNLGNMEQKQMQKIEELTLYLIQAEKSINELRNQNEELQDAMKEFKQTQMALEKEVKQLKKHKMK
ncbi:MAG: hypothetical protein EPN39_13625 [Chitinophagaceae bacterium]|nr:MAG: hypothetical protein EPN39_13625 [Chitinophagaceae bacterium]